MYSIPFVKLHIIDSTRYKKLSPVRYSIYAALFLLTFSVLPLPHIKYHVLTSHSLAYDIGVAHWIIYIIIILLIAVAIPLYFYSKNYPVLGSLLLETEQLTITDPNNDTTTYPLSEVEHLKISRGSTVHKSDNGMYAPETNNNWISFIFHQAEIKYEFAIENEEENNAFEAVVYKLRSMMEGFVYTSI